MEPSTMDIKVVAPPEPKYWMDWWFMGEGQLLQWPAAAMVGSKAVEK